MPNDKGLAPTSGQPGAAPQSTSHMRRDLRVLLDDTAFTSEDAGGNNPPTFPPNSFQTHTNPFTHGSIRLPWSELPPAIERLETIIRDEVLNAAVPHNDLGIVKCFYCPANLSAEGHDDNCHMVVIEEMAAVLGIEIDYDEFLE